jgi:hypothetical protein
MQIECSGSDVRRNHLVTVARHIYSLVGSMGFTYGCACECGYMLKEKTCPAFRWSAGVPLLVLF